MFVVSVHGAGDVAGDSVAEGDVAWGFGALVVGFVGVYGGREFLFGGR